MRREIGSRLGPLIRTYRSALGLTQADLSELVGQETGDGSRPSQGKVSEHEGGEWKKGAIENFAAAYGRALGIPEQEIADAIGFTPPGSSPPRPTFEDIVRADPSLDEASKQHMINQYGLLRAASRHNRTRSPSPDRATG